MRGKRQDQQDTICVSDMSKHPHRHMHVILGVFDGHGGENTSQYVCNKYHEYVRDIIYPPGQYIFQSMDVTENIQYYYEKKM